MMMEGAVGEDAQQPWIVTEAPVAPSPSTATSAAVAAGVNPKTPEESSAPHDDQAPTAAHGTLPQP